MRTGTRETTTVTVKYKFRKLTEGDQTIPFRFVGSFEYANALESFNHLVEISDASEVKVYNEFLSSRPEFTYFQGVSTAFQKRPDMTTAKPEERTRFNDKFQKGGLAWMMALAQIELGATMSMYGNSKTPFSDVASPDFAHEEYLSLLIDDLISHLRAISQEELFGEVLNVDRIVDTWTLAYLRRLKVIKDMMISISDVADPDTVEELRPYLRDVKSHEDGLVNIVNIWLASSVEQDTQTATRDLNQDRLSGAVNAVTGSNSPLSPALIRQCNQRIGQEYQPARDTRRQTRPGVKQDTGGSRYRN